MINRYDTGAGELTQQSKARATLAEDLGDSQLP